jgi:hypothetical protein
MNKNTSVSNCIMRCPTGDIDHAIDFDFMESLQPLFRKYHIMSLQDLFAIYCTESMFQHFRNRFTVEDRYVWDMDSPKRAVGLSLLLTDESPNSTLFAQLIKSMRGLKLLFSPVPSNIITVPECPFGKLVAGCVTGFNDMLLIFLAVHQVKHQQQLYEIYSNLDQFNRFRANLQPAARTYWDAVAPSQEIGLTSLSVVNRVPVYVARPTNLEIDTPACSLQWITPGELQRAQATMSAGKPRYYETQQQCAVANPLFQSYPLVAPYLPLLSSNEVLLQYSAIALSAGQYRDVAKQPILYLMEKLRMQNIHSTPQQQVLLNPCDLFIRDGEHLELWRYALLPRFNSCLEKVDFDDCTLTSDSSKVLPTKAVWDFLKFIIEHELVQPNLQHLVYYVTKVGNLNFLKFLRARKVDMEPAWAIAKKSGHGCLSMRGLKNHSSIGLICVTSNK